jgi:NAD(P)H-dependent FMN reductase
MHFLVIIASERRNGNSDLLGRWAVRYALKSGVDSGEIVYLKDFELKQCQGCLNCLKTDHKCKIEDDLYRLLDIIKDADRLLLIAPVYVLSIPGKLKLLLDRFLLALGRRVIDSLIVYGAGPGEVLLNDSLIAVQSSVDKLVESQGAQYESGVKNYCPVDYNTLFEHVKDDRFRCPVCLTPAKLTPHGYYFEADDLKNHRWTQRKLQDHFENWILRTRPRFKAMLKEIMRKKRELSL